MDNFGTWWESLSGIYRFFWTTSVISSVVFIVMVILSVIGGDSDADADADFDADGDAGGDADMGGGMMSYILSFKTLMAFLLGASWTGLSALYQGWSVFAIALVSILSGMLMMALMAFLLSMFVKLQHDSTLEMSNTIGASGVAYVTIPASGGTGGQVEILVNNSYKTFEAITDEATPIATEEPIVVADLLEGNVLLVRRAKAIDGAEQEQQLSWE
jgi:membrane protein implicated in regulation of membrane protease activity